MSASAQTVSYSVLEGWAPKGRNTQFDVLGIPEKWRIPSDFHAPLENPNEFPTLSEDDLKFLSEIFSGFENPSFDMAGDTNPPALSMASQAQDDILSPSTLDSQFPIYPHPVAEPWNSVAVQEGRLASTGVHEQENLTHESPSSRSAESSPSVVNPMAYVPQQSDDRRSYGDTVAPSKRHKSLCHRGPPSHRPYPSPSERPFYERHFSSCDSSMVEQRRSAVGLAHIPSVLSDLPIIAETRQDHQALSRLEGDKPLEENHHVRNGGRITVPLREWRAKRSPKGPQTRSTIEFWSIEHATGKKLTGTYLADRFRDDTGRSLLSEEEHPFPGKKEKGFNFRLLWPGYPEFSKKISIHKQLSECTLADVRGWVFGALADFIRTHGMAPDQVSGSWRVGADDDVGAIHLNDIILVRLKQMGKGTWVPELDVLN